MNPEWIKKYQVRFQKDKDREYLKNAIANSEIYNVIANKQLLQSYDKTFSNVIDFDTKVSYQKKSKRCWIFSFTNLLRHLVINKYNLDESFQLSQNYLYFYDKLEKSKYFLEVMYRLKDLEITSQSIKYFLDKPIGDGGCWNMAVNIVETYGIVPQSIMGESYQSNNSQDLNYFHNLHLKEGAYIIRKNNFSKKDFEVFLEDKIYQIYKLLVLFLGEPPQAFNWTYYLEVDDNKKKRVMKDLTPITFYQKCVPFQPNDYSVLYNLPIKKFPYYHRYLMEYCNNMMGGYQADFVNIPMKVMISLAKKSIDNNEPVWFAADVRHYVNRKEGIADLDIFQYDLLKPKDPSHPFKKGDRLLYSLSTPNHAMLIYGYDKSSHKIDKWYIENSWGNKVNNGFLYMSNDWFKEYVFEVVVKKNILGKKMLKSITQKDIIKLYPWETFSCEALSVQ